MFIQLIGRQPLTRMKLESKFRFPPTETIFWFHYMLSGPISMVKHQCCTSANMQVSRKLLLSIMTSSIDEKTKNFRNSKIWQYCQIEHHMCTKKLYYDNHVRSIVAEILLTKVLEKCWVSIFSQCLICK